MDGFACLAGPVFGKIGAQQQLCFKRWNNLGVLAGVSNARMGIPPPTMVWRDLEKKYTCRLGFL